MKRKTIQRRKASRYASKFDERRFGIPMEWTWDVDYTFAKFMIPVLKAFKEKNNGYPPDLTPEKWDEIIQKIIDGFEIIVSDDPCDSDYNVWKEKMKVREEQIQESLDLFAKWARKMWW